MLERVNLYATLVSCVRKSKVLETSAMLEFRVM